MKRHTWADRKEVVLRRELVRVLEKHHGNRTYAAKELGIAREHVLRLINRFGLRGIC